MKYFVILRMFSLHFRQLGEISGVDSARLSPVRFVFILTFISYYINFFFWFLQLPPERIFASNTTPPSVSVLNRSSPFFYTYTVLRSSNQRQPHLFIILYVCHKASIPEVSIRQILRWYHRPVIFVFISVHTEE